MIYTYERQDKHIKLFGEAFGEAMDLVVHFIWYLKNQTGISHTTYCAYRHDIQEFYDFIMRNSWSLTLDTFTPATIEAYKYMLEQKRVSTAIARRKLVVIRLLCKFLHEQYAYTDYTASPVFTLVDRNLPIMCPAERVTALKKHDNYHALSWQELRNQLLIELLSTVSLTVAHVVTLKKSNFCFTTHTMQFVTTRGIYKRFDITSRVLDLLDYYLRVVPYSSDYIFCVAIKNTVKPLSRQAAWALIKTLVQEPHSPLLLNSTCQQVTDEIRTLYKKHPRA